MKKGIFITIRKSKIFKGFLFIFSILYSALSILPQNSFALTSGPSQPEAMGFTPAEQQQPVDPFTGDFSYNIPLFSIGDYPINLSYSSSGVNMDAEASWVGLGWNLNTGVINRTMRGLPDDFNGDVVKREFNMKDNFTVGGSVGVDIMNNIEVAGYELGKNLNGIINASVGIGASLNLKFNNYTGISIGKSVGVTGGVSAGVSDKEKANAASAASQAGETAKPFLVTSLGISGGLTASTGADGMNIQPRVSFSSKMNYGEKSDIGLFTGSLGLQFNSRTGLMSRTLSLTPHFIGSTKLIGPISFTPKFQFPFATKAFTFSFKFGGKILPVEMSATATGFSSRQSLKEKTIERSAYGYIYLEDGQQDEYSLLDFNREKDGGYMPGTPHLPPAYLTNDIFSVGAQGIGGTYRPYRNEAGYIFDSRVDNSSSSESIGGEINIGNAEKVGMDETVVDINSHSSCWLNGNIASSTQKFQKQEINTAIRNVYFKKIGQISKTVSDNFLSGTGNYEPVRYTLPGGSDQPELLLMNAIAPSSVKNDEPIMQSEPFQTITVKQVLAAKMYQKQYLPSEAKPHHIGQITILGNDGKKYVFGLPAYNNLQKEVSFSVAHPANDAGALVHYVRGVDNSIGNHKGLSRYFESTTLSPFSYAYYLTDVLSPDYSDMTGDGPTWDDYGTYTRFFYTKKYSAFRWRTPFQMDSAQYDPGLLSMDDDDKGHYVYGTRDVWYVDSIATKNEIAVFHSSPRNDAYETIGENGGKNAGCRPLLRLDSISLYNIHDRLTADSGATPLKRIHFVYDYSLCNKLPNGDEGKLTLKKIYFTYENSYKSKNEYYAFTYSAYNPSYKIDASDAWGTYKPGDPAMPNKYFPFTLQDKTLSGQYASAWLLEKIDLPNGGYTQIAYESDDYNYVQNKPAMKMYRVIGSTRHAPLPGDFDSTNTTLFDGVLNKNNKSFFIFSFDKNITDPVAAQQELKTLFGSGNEAYSLSKNLYFKFKINLDGGEKAYDFVYGFAEMEGSNSCGIVRNDLTGIYYGWVQVKLVETDRNVSLNVNPVSKAAFHFCRINTPKYAYGQVAFKDFETDPVGAIADLWGNVAFINQLVELLEGPGQVLRTNGIGKHFIPEQSSIRLFCRNKLGGGARVKEITNHNGWDVMKPGEDVLTYTDEYNYTLEDEQTSSGVAEYEPLLAGDEIPQHLPVTYSPETDRPRWSRMLIPDERYMQIEPYGELAFPSPSVGYSRVTINRRVPSNSSSPGTGYSEYYFYTSKDFPLQAGSTPLKEERRKKKPSFSFFKKESYDFVYATQGYSVILNDMHGKLKKSYIYDAYGRLISGIENEYSLDKKLIYINTNSTAEKDKLNAEMDFVSDFREQESCTESQSIHANIGKFIWPAVPPVPIIIPWVVPLSEKETTRFRSATTTKIIYNYAVLLKQTATDLGGRIETENLVFDPVTGSPVLTKVNNAFFDPVYNFSYPARVIYSGMDAASQNTGHLCQISTDGNGQISSGSSLLFPGDELLSGGGIYGWVYKHINGNNYLINRYGNPLEGVGDQFTVIHSGHRNILNAGCGSVTTLVNPLVQINPNKWKLEFAGDNNALDANAVTYRDYWFKPAKNYLNKGKLPGAFYPYTLPPEMVKGCNCVKNDVTLKFEEFFKKIIENGKITTTEPYIFGPTVHDTTWFGEQNGNTITGYYIDGHVDWVNSNNYKHKLKKCFTITDRGNHNFSCIQDFLKDVLFPKDISVSFELPAHCNPRSFDMVLTKVFHNQNYTLTFPVTSCFDMFKCQQEECSTGIEPGGSRPCVCSLSPYGMKWEEVFDLLVNDKDDNNFLPLGTTVTPVSATDICPDDPCINILNPDGPPENTFVGITWVTSPFDSSRFLLLNYNSSGTIITDTCFYFPAGWSGEFDSVMKFILKNEGKLEVKIPEPIQCDEDKQFFDLIITLPVEGDGEETFRLRVESRCGDIYNCPPLSAVPAIPTHDATVAIACRCPRETILNPYVSNILGDWRRYEDFSCLVERNPVSVSSGINLRTDGAYRNFSPFWSYYSTTGWKNDTVTWSLANRITVYDINGNALVSKDAIGIYISADFGYNSQLPVAVCSNAKSTEMGYDGFEDYYSDFIYALSNNTSSCYNSYHLKFEDYTHRITAEKAHTGLYSLSGMEEFSFTSFFSIPRCDSKSLLSGSPCFSSPASGQMPYILRSGDKIPAFSPEYASQKRTFVFSFWALHDSLPGVPFKMEVLMEETLSASATLSDVYDALSKDANDPPLFNIKLALQPSYISPPIEGWRQYTYKFDIPAYAAGRFRVRIFGITKEIFLDDFRIHPFLSNMKSFVYNPFTNRLAAILDENNFAEFYQYDEKGNLQAVRRETERGIVGVNYFLKENKLK